MMRVPHIRHPPSLRTPVIASEPLVRAGEAIQKATRSVCPPSRSGLLHQRQIAARLPRPRNDDTHLPL
ncbi:MAG: hypothetical protein LBT00_10390 [Spirochaetaceae bacterium]|nr:hypothetical protein [Spirochaetaceae bacterium]